MKGFQLDSIPTQAGRIAIVTGANAGLGYETVIHLARKNMKIIMACRNEAKATKAKQEIERKVTGADLEVMILDLSKLASVRKFAKQYHEKYDKLDILINNAGIMLPPYSRTEDGFESQMGTNYLGHFLLTDLLLDLMPDTPDSRIVTLSSIAHKPGRGGGGVINFEDIHWQNSYSASNAYSQSKLACLMFTFELQRRLETSGKKILSVGSHPGVALTELVRHMPKWQVNVLRFTVGPFITHSPINGALPTVLAAIYPNVKGGDYFGPTGFNEMKGKPGHAQISEYAQSKEIAEKLWEVSLDLTKAEYKYLGSQKNTASVDG